MNTVANPSTLAALRAAGTVARARSSARPALGAADGGPCVPWPLPSLLLAALRAAAATVGRSVVPRSLAPSRPPELHLPPSLWPSPSPFGARRLAARRPAAAGGPTMAPSPAFAPVGAAPAGALRLRCRRCPADGGGGGGRALAGVGHGRRAHLGTPPLRLPRFPSRGAPGAATLPGASPGGGARPPPPPPHGRPPAHVEQPEQLAVAAAEQVAREPPPAGPPDSNKPGPSFRRRGADADDADDDDDQTSITTYCTCARCFASIMVRPEQLASPTGLLVRCAVCDNSFTARLGALENVDGTPFDGDAFLHAHLGLGRGGMGGGCLGMRARTMILG
ncbi:hypothetical protein BU14_0258s0012 [Porphyra umbilicalis]|uniref:Uncharacterized protein n=1 Tax=Porphyra umbilicalis TaxID=2786 RepID=A0A1X6P2F6_PORUM|nr:hypothetical protein BU14_0258s0012 [Porphyra umbilicalis]|eukprot:OSX75007.1 hypothetical protein BU14_0258s0012 [Porphyra umbilicalis]